MLKILLILGIFVGVAGLVFAFVGSYFHPFCQYCKDNRYTKRVKGRVFCGKHQFLDRDIGEGG